MADPSQLPGFRLELTRPDGGRIGVSLPPEGLGPVRVGRSPENELQIASPFVSRRHGVFVRQDHRLVYRDLRSTSGSYVAGRRIRSHTLEPGDAVCLGGPDGDRITVCELDLDVTQDAWIEPPGTEVIHVTDRAESAYLRAQREQPGRSRDARGRRTADRLVETRLRALISLTTDLLEVPDADAMADVLLARVLEILPVQRGMVLLNGPEGPEPRVWFVRQDPDFDRVTPAGGTLPDISADLTTEGPVERSGELPFQPIGTVVRRVFGEGVGLLTLDAQQDQRLSGSRSVFMQSVRSILAAPIATREQVYGVLYLDTPRALSADDDSLDWLVAVGGQSGMVMQKLELLRQQRAMFESMMRGLAASIDARDGMTAGHSARVAHYAAGLAEHLGLSAERVFAVRYAALLHDYGKIGVDDAVLRKPARLTEEEYEHVRRHPHYTFDILKKIEFPPELADLPLMAASHHERWDGRGYPWGLKGKDIPLAGRIIAIADVYDSLTRKRHYRTPMGEAEVLSHLEEGRGSHFDPDLLDAFVEYHRVELAAKAERRRRKRARHRGEAEASPPWDTLDAPAEPVEEHTAVRPALDRTRP